MKYEAHDLAKLFPMMDEPELQELANSIKANGQRDPIIMHEGKILDGRNRYAACQLAGVDPIERPFTGKDPLAFVMDQNLSRRHLTTSQRALVAEKLATMKSGTRTDLQPSANLPEAIYRLDKQTGDNQDADGSGPAHGSTPDGRTLTLRSTSTFCEPVSISTWSAWNRSASGSKPSSAPQARHLLLRKNTG
jgi:hypothetical protein